MGSLVLAGATSGSTTITPSATGTYTITLPAETGTIQTSGAGFTTNGVAYASSTSALTTGSALTFNGTNLGIGTSSPAYTLDVKSAGTGVVTNGIRFSRSTTSTQYGVLNFENAQFNNVVVNTAGSGCYWGVLYSTDGSTFTSPMSLDSSGNLGIGTSSPSFRIEVVSPAGDYITGLFRTGDATAANNAGGGFRGISSATATSRQAQMWLDADGANFGGGDYFYISKNGNSGNVDFIQTSNAAITFQTAGSERARIDSSGNLLVGTTSVLLSGKFSSVAGSQNGGAFQTTATANNNTAIAGARNGNAGNVAEWWYSTSTQVGTIAVTASATAYNTSSDYRLKEDIQPMTGALAKVAALKPVTYKWKTDGSDGEGFIAHELAEICPHAVTGEKDAVDAEGNPKYQGIDTSFLVATLTAAIQELSTLITAQSATITSLTERITALENK